MTYPTGQAGPFLERVISDQSMSAEPLEDPHSFLELRWLFSTVNDIDSVLGIKQRMEYKNSWGNGLPQKQSCIKHTNSSQTSGGLQCQNKMS
jgi:hypothetical protein